MAQESARPRLGRGLAALIGDAGEQRKAAASSAEAAAPGRGSRRVPIEFLKANPRNPRRTFTQGELDALTESIRERGVIQPIVVRAKVVNGGGD